MKLKKWLSKVSDFSGQDQCARSPEAQAAFINQQAQKFQVTPEEFQQLATHCKGRIASIKHNANFFQEFGGERTYISNSYKDIYHGLMNPRLTDTDVLMVKDLIAHSELPGEIQSDPQRKQTERAFIQAHFLFGSFSNEGVEKRTLGHQFKIEEGGGLEPEKIEPFIRGMSI